MKERPIIFNSEMVRAILGGRKTVTRRPIKWPKWINAHEYEEAAKRLSRTGYLARIGPCDGIENEMRSPFGQIGDRLWVRETWMFNDWEEDGYPQIKYKADNGIKWCENIPFEVSDKILDIWEELSDPKNYNIESKASDKKWRPSIHMSRWASRITLEITDVRVEKVQDISEEDAKKEGFSNCPYYNKDEYETMIPAFFENGKFNFAKTRFINTWNSIYPGSWERNDWVFVTEFKPVEMGR